MDAVSYSNFRQNLKSYMKRLNDDAMPMIVTAKEKDDNVVAISQRDYDTMTETMYLLSNPDVMARIQDGETQLENHDLKTHKLLER